MKKKYTVIEYVTIVREYYDIEAESDGDATDIVIENSEREPDNEYVLKGNGWEAEEQEEQKKGGE